MANRRRWMGGLSAWLALLAVAGPGAAQPPRAPTPLAFPVRAEGGPALPATPTIPYGLLSPGAREKVRRVVEGPSLSAHGPAEAFACQPALYRWLLDHPREGGFLWRLVGAKVTDVEDRGAGRYGYRDAQGSDVQWETVLDTSEMRIWLAEGKAKPGALVPAVHGRVVVVLLYREGKDARGRSILRHQAHLFVRTDSRALALVARMLGGTAPRIAENCMAQLEMFFGALAWYLDQDSARAERMFQRIGLQVPPGTVRPL